MSKTERRKLFQPIPLSSILDPTYQAPFSKLEQFQVDMDISSKLNGRAPQTVWQKLQSSLISAMSNFVIMSTTSVAAMSQRSVNSMSLVPCKSSWKPCELLLSNEVKDCQANCESGESVVPEKSSLYHSVRSGLQCLRFLATQPLNFEDEENKQSKVTQTPTRHYIDCRKQHNNILLPRLGYSLVGEGALFFPQTSTADSSCYYSLSAPTTPLHHSGRQARKPVVSNLFSWAMSGLFLATPLQHRYIDTLYNNFCLLSPVNVKGTEIHTNMLCSRQRSTESMDKASTAPNSTNAEGNLEILIHSSYSTQDSKPGKEVVSNRCKPPACVLSSSKPLPVSNSPVKSSTSGMGGNGCIRIESNWTSMDDEGGSSTGRANFHTVSVCSSSSNLKNGTLTFSCSSTMSSSPRAMMSSAARSAARRFQTESESSTDSFVEFSASVESTDSFCIVFESAGDCLDEQDIDREEDDDEWEDDDDDDDDDSEEDEDQIFNYSSTSDDIFVDGYIFQADGIDMGVSPPTPSGDQVDFCQGGTVPAKSRKKKTVSFDETNLEHIIEFEDDDKSKSCREMYWEMMRRDNARFQDRILRTGEILEPVLSPVHRTNIYRQRFGSVQDAH